ncbi:quinone oxidoreductase [Aeromicrobium sp. YIM 150415]|uniref:quinone oxidoreductase family protein n=1 Tax=Aeromicrobium sp. YIM 150415 TaxID=2803912 RepID=UPI001962C734|nr:quinone oxidoreductase [Aeromicrobium sp. YIM 150415]MBM9461887.1 quinone oxidoreductase [Aeromicrobium sp. YIM 150415]
MSHAIVIEETGGPEVMQWREVPRPEPGPGELLVEVGAAGVNFIDTYLRTGTYRAPLPFTPGKEGAGQVAAVGDGVTGFAPGDRVAWAMGDGGYAEHVVVPASLAVRVPDDVDDQQAAAVLLQGMTAHFLTHSIVQLDAGDTALLHAGAGGVGLLLTQMLSHRGVRVLTTVSTSQKARLSREAGAQEVIVGYDRFDERVRELTDGLGARVVYDGVGRDTFDRSLDAVRTRGTMVLFGAASGPVPPVDPQTLNAKGSLVLTRPALNDFIADRAELDWRAADLFAAVAAGEIDVRVGAAYPMRDAARAHEDLEARRTTGKVMLTI